MIRILKIALLLVCLSQIVKANYTYFATDELLDRIAKRDLSDTIHLNLNGSIFEAGFYEKRDRTPVTIMGDDEEEGPRNFLIDGSHEVYSNSENNTVITVTTHRNPETGEERRTVRASIYLPESDEMITVEPDDIHSNRSRVSRRSLDKRETSLFNRTNLADEDDDDYLKRETSKRGGNDIKYVELMMVADYTFYKMLIDQLGTNSDEKIAIYVEAYFSQLAFLAQQVYERSLENEDIQIKIVPIEFIILKSSQSSSFTTSSEAQATLGGESYDQDTHIAYTNVGAIIGGQKTGLLAKWINDKLSGKKFDALVAVTATNLCECNRNSKVAYNPDVMGMAPLEGICQQNRNAFIIEAYKSNLNMEFLTLAHELGHNLGFDHDGDAGCDNEDGFLMAEKYGTTSNAFRFSECSVTRLNEVNQKGKYQCLQNQVQPDQDVKRYSSFFPGQVFTLADQCKLALGDEGLTIPKIIQPGELSPNGEPLEENLCQTLYCMNENGGYYSLRPAFEKSSCGDGKWCVAGECVDDQRAPKGQCLTETDFKYCKKIDDQGYDVCEQYGQTRCCEFCNKGYKTVKSASSQSMSEWLKAGTVNNARFI